ncbi:helix-turn-helix domain-containing protein [Paraglaciecola sp.]|uniref:helix-turn-helix domain-containing protein n=1 Tax=Paraglaciecola sp. TaxID=1920173 RepID=UPI0030F48BC5
MNASSQFFAHLDFALMFMCGMLLIPNVKKSRTILLFLVLMLCGCGYLLTPLFDPLEKLSVIWWLNFVAQNALPGIFWLVSLNIFADQKELKTWHYLTASLTLVIPTVANLTQIIFSYDLQYYPAFYGLVTYGALTLELVLISHALIEAIRHSDVDLVQERRYIRVSVIGIVAIYIVIVIVIEQLFHWQWLWLDTVKYALLCLVLLVINFLLFSLKEGTLFDQAIAQKVRASNKAKPSPELKRILDSMQKDKLYKEEGMTISTLSRHLGIHEYKLRHLINGELNYRNFNDFLNFYRIQEVAQKLAQNEVQKLPVLTLALDSGFRSLSSFNKAFKNKYGVTPTEFRNQHS